MTESRLSEVPAFSRHDTLSRRREIAAAGASANQHLEIIKQRLKVPNLTAIEVDIQPASLSVCTDLFKIMGLQTGPNQRIGLRLYEQWYDGTKCIKVFYDLNQQFTGYGAYLLSFEKDVTNSGLFSKFFGDFLGYGVNLHRTILFVNENLENQTPGAVFRLLNDGDQHQVAPRDDYLNNLNKLVQQAKMYGIVVQVCLFMHHSVANDFATTPAPVVLSGNPAQRYKAFYNITSPFLPMQQNLIDKVVAKLNPHWNVIYEIGNELRVPAGTVTDYDKTNLTAWIDWAAARIRMTSPHHLITTSTGIDNEADVNHLSRIQFCSFHQGQWAADLNGAVLRAKNNYGGKHLVLDDDGGARLINSVRNWSKAALNANGGCCASFNHKGFSPTNAYNSGWKNTPPAAGESQPSQALDALNTARTTSSSPCAGN